MVFASPGFISHHYNDAPVLCHVGVSARLTPSKTQHQVVSRHFPSLFFQRGGAPHSPTLSPFVYTLFKI